MRGLPRHYMLHPARYVPPRYIRLRAKLHDKCPVRGQWRLPVGWFSHHVAPASGPWRSCLPVL